MLHFLTQCRHHARAGLNPSLIYICRDRTFLRLLFLAADSGANVTLFDTKCDFCFASSRAPELTARIGL